jgi:hypothetical protein
MLRCRKKLLVPMFLSIFSLWTRRLGRSVVLDRQLSYNKRASKFILVAMDRSIVALSRLKRPNPGAVEMLRAEFSTSKVKGVAMQITGLHLLLTYQCTLECDHCFVWGSPQQSGVMSLAEVRLILDQASQMESLQSIYFEGGEPFKKLPGRDSRLASSPTPIGPPARRMPSKPSNPSPGWFRIYPSAATCSIGASHSAFKPNTPPKPPGGWESPAA